MKQKFSLETMKSTGNQAVDGVASCILDHRKRKIPLKAIHLKPMYYDWFKAWTQIMLRRPLGVGELMQFESVAIEKGSPFQQQPILPEVWPDARPPKDQLYVSSH